jgi:chemotaxis protein methyltransferase CheR
VFDATAVRPLSDREFRLLQEVIYREAGIHLGDSKKALMNGRLIRRLRALGCATFTAYSERLQTDAAERVVMLDCIATNETLFFREPKQFEFLQSTVLPRWRSLGDAGVIPKRVRAWSTACSTGEEPYTMAMVLGTHFPAEGGWSVEILASDLSTRALDAAREAVWPIERSGDIPEPFRKAWMLRGLRSEAGRMRASRELQALIEFRRINLNDDDYGVRGTFDLIFCRNVLIYFDRVSKAGVMHRLTRHLAPEGLLLLGHAESLTGINHGLKHAGPTIYRRDEPGAGVMPFAVAAATF